MFIYDRKTSCISKKIIQIVCLSGQPIHLAIYLFTYSYIHLSLYSIYLPTYTFTYPNIHPHILKNNLHLENIQNIFYIYPSLHTFTHLHSTHLHFYPAKISASLKKKNAFHLENIPKKVQHIKHNK